MIPLLGVKGVIYAVAAITVTGAITAGVMHYRSLVKDRAELTARASLAEAELKAGQESAKRYREETEKQVVALRQTLRDLSDEFASERARREKVGKLLSKHDLSRLAQKKPGLVGRRVNDGTSRLWLNLEQSTRSDTRREPSETSNGVPTP